jgi:hypothetical protein
MEGQSMFDHYGMPKPRTSVLSHPRPKERINQQRPELAKPLALVSVREALEPPKEIFRNPNIEVRVLAQRSQFMTLQKPAQMITGRGGSLGTICRKLANILCQESRTSPRIGAQPDYHASAPLSNNIMQVRHKQTVAFVRVDKVIRVGQNCDLKTVAAVFEKGSDLPLMYSVSGWASTPRASDKVLNNSRWSKAVWQFCELLGHKLKYNNFDKAYLGQEKSCHAEKQLMLWFVLHYLSDEVTGVLDEKKLRDIRLRPTPLEGLLTLDKRPCADCESFRKKLEDLTGIYFSIEICPKLRRTDTPAPKTVKTRRRQKPKYRVEKKRSDIKKHSIRPDPFAEAIEIEFDMTKNPRIVVLIPTQLVPKQVSVPQTPRRRSQKNTSGVLSPPITPVRPTRRNGLWTPTSSPFSFEELDKVDRRRHYGRKGTKQNPYVLT